MSYKVGLTREVKPTQRDSDLDMSRFIFGPFCTQMLGDMGAEIIKVEPLGLGDPSRAAGNVMVNGISASYLARNRNKRSLAMDMRKPEAQEIAFQ